MPDSVTHFYLAEDAYKSLKPDIDYDYLMMGAQGPDPLFYYHYQPWKKGYNASKIASIIHHENTKAFLDTFIKYAKNSTKQVKGYIMGFLCHYALDTTAHPYIFYVTGNYSKKHKEYRGNHLRLERAIDAILISEKGINPKYFKVYEYFNIQDFTKEFEETMDKVIEEVHGFKNIGPMFVEACKDMRSIFKNMSYDPTGIKKAVYKVVDSFTTGPTLYQTLSYNINIKKHDYMNRLNNVWKHPVTGDESTETFDDLYNKALSKATNLISKTMDYFKNGSEEIFSLIENIQYDTGLDCQDKRKMKFFNSIFN